MGYTDKVVPVKATETLKLVGFCAAYMFSLSLVQMTLQLDLRQKLKWYPSVIFVSSFSSKWCVSVGNSGTLALLQDSLSFTDELRRTRMQESLISLLKSDNNYLYLPFLHQNKLGEILRHREYKEPTLDQRPMDFGKDFRRDLQCDSLQ